MLISQNMAFTVNLGNYQSAKVEVGIGDLDTAGDIDAQINEALAVVDKTFKPVYDKVAQEIKYIIREENSNASE